MRPTEIRITKSDVLPSNNTTAVVRFRRLQTREKHIDNKRVKNDSTALC